MTFKHKEVRKRSTALAKDHHPLRVLLALVVFCGVLLSASLFYYQEVSLSSVKEIFRPSIEGFSSLGLTGAAVGIENLDISSVETGPRLSVSEMATSTSCGEVNESLTLSANLSVTGTCFVINASNIVFDCNNYWIVGSGSSDAAIYVFNQTNITIQNCYTNGSFGASGLYGILLDSVTNSSVLNNGIYNEIHIRGIVPTNMVYDNNYIFYLSNAYYSNITNNRINILGDVRDSYLYNNTFTGMVSLSRENNLSQNNFTTTETALGIEPYSHYIDQSNTINGKPIIYYYTISNQIFENNASWGGMYIYNATNITFSNITLTENGIYFQGTNITIINNNISTSDSGLYIVNQVPEINSLITGNTISYNSGLYLYGSNQNITKNNFLGTREMSLASNNLTFTENNVSSASLTLYPGTDFTISYNNFSNGTCTQIHNSESGTFSGNISHNFFSPGYMGTGIGFYSISSNNSMDIFNNSIQLSGDNFGITLSAVNQRINLSGNQIYRNGLRTTPYLISGTSITHFNHSIGEDNLVNGSIFKYYFNQQDASYSNLNYGEVEIAYSNNLSYTNLNLSGELIEYHSNNLTFDALKINSTSWGIYSYNSSYNLLNNSEIRGYESNAKGMINYLSQSNSNSLINSIVVSILSSTSGVIYSSYSHNNLFDNLTLTGPPTVYDINMANSDNNTIRNSNISGNTGVYLLSCQATRIYNNTISAGISIADVQSLSDPLGQEIYYNNVQSISFTQGKNNKIYNNTINGTLIVGCTNCEFSYNNLTRPPSISYYSIILVTGSNNTFTSDTANCTLCTSISFGSATFIDPHFGTNVSFALDGGNLTVKRYLDVNVTNSTGALENANVSIYDVNSLQINNSLTAVSGFTPRFTLTEFWQNGSQKNYSTPHTINVSKTGYTPNTIVVDLSQTNSTQINIALSPVEIPTCGYINSNTNLTQNLTSSGTCFTINASNIILDGKGHTIRGDLSGNGVYLETYTNVTVTNLTVLNFNNGIYIYSAQGNLLRNNYLWNNSDYGLWLNSAQNNTILNNTISNNSGYGIRLDYLVLMLGSNNTIINNTLQENRYSDFYINPQLESNCNNLVENNLGSGGRKIMYYNGSVSLSNDVNISDLILCNADNSNINNVTVQGSDTLANNEIYSFFTDNLTLNNSNSSYNLYGIVLVYSTNSTLKNNVVLSNELNNIYLSTGSDNCTLINNFASGSSNGFRIDSSNNFLVNNSVIDNAQGIFITSPNNHLNNNNISATGNAVIFSSSNNLISGGKIQGVFNDLVCSAENNTLINVSFNKTKTSLTDSGKIYVKWYVTANITNAGGTSLENANVSARYYNDTLEQSNSTLNTGFTTLTLTEYYENSTAKYYQTPHIINTSLSGYLTNLTSLNLSQTNSTLLNIVLSLVPAVDNYPVVTLRSPTNGYTTSDTLVNITFNCSAVDDVKLSNISLYITNSSNQSLALNQTTNVGGTSNSSNWTLELSTGDYSWNCLAYDNASQSSFATSNYTFRIGYTAPSGGGGGGGGATKITYACSTDADCTNRVLRSCNGVNVEEVTYVYGCKNPRTKEAECSVKDQIISTIPCANGCVEGECLVKQETEVKVVTVPPIKPEVEEIITPPTIEDKSYMGWIFLIISLILISTLILIKIIGYYQEKKQPLPYAPIPGPSPLPPQGPVSEITQKISDLRRPPTKEVRVIQKVEERMPPKIEAPRPVARRPIIVETTKNKVKLDLEMMDVQLKLKQLGDTEEVKKTAKVIQDLPKTPGETRIGEAQAKAQSKEMKGLSTEIESSLKRPYLLLRKIFPPRKSEREIQVEELARRQVIEISKKIEGNTPRPPNELEQLEEEIKKLRKGLKDNKF